MFEHIKYSFFVLLFFSGCISTNGFDYESVKEPCSIITADEMVDLIKTETCQPVGLDVEEVSITLLSGNGTGCVYHRPNSSLSLVRIDYIPNEEKTYEEYKNDSCYIACSIVEEDLGMGDNSFLLEQSNPRGAETLGIAVVVFEGSSVIAVYNNAGNQYPYQCFNETKAKEIAALALSRLKE